MSAFAAKIVPFGEAGWLARLEGGDMIACALAANAIAGELRTLRGVTDAVAGVDSVALRFNPSRLPPGEARKALEAAIRRAPAETAAPQSRIDIPVCYGGEYGPDLGALSKALSLKEDEIVRLHSMQPYRVLTIGFAPGFAYLGPLPEPLQTRRRATPRPRVAAGSVGVAGAMTGVYPLASPGGWPLIGRTPKTLFNAKSETPFLFAPGAEVSFTPIGEAAFAQLEAKAQ